MNLLIIIAVVLAVMVLVRLANVVQLVTTLAEEDPQTADIKENKINALFMLGFMVVGLFLVVYMTIRFQPYMLGVPASIHGVELDSLLNWNFLVIGIVFFITQIALFWFVFKYQFRKGERAYYYPHNNTIEFIWTIIPTIVLSALIVTGLSSWNKITQTDNKDGMVVEVYGKQFQWTIRYSGVDNTLGKSNFRKVNPSNVTGVDSLDPAAADDIIAQELHMPVNTPMQFYFHSSDVIHSAYFPHFRAQMNCVPGMTTNFYFVPTITTEKMREITGNPKFNYVLLCNKICGSAHFNMNTKIVVESKADFLKWLKTQKFVFPKPESKSAEAPAEASKVTALK
jgi:cytochrome c oxidase subunit 2